MGGAATCMKRLQQARDTTKELIARRQVIFRFFYTSLIQVYEVAKTWMEYKTYNRRDSQMVTHSSTSRPVQCLCMAERTGCPVFTDLWSYVSLLNRSKLIKL
jgi:hypothetical protein